MIVVRLARGGAKKHPFYHIVVTDSRRRRDSGYLEKLGYFNPFAVKDETPVLLNWERFDYWISKGAKSSPRVSSIISKLERKTDQKTDSGTTESPTATATETETQALELEDKPESTQKTEQATSPKAEAQLKDISDTPSAETPAEPPEANKGTDNK